MVTDRSEIIKALDVAHLLMHTHPKLSQSGVDAIAILRAHRDTLEREATFVEAAWAIWKSEDLIFHPGGTVEIPNELAMVFANAARKAEAKGGENHSRPPRPARSGEGMKLAIVGSRSITDIIQVKGAMILAEKSGPYDWNDITEIISGGARGVDYLAAQIAHESNIPLKEIKPQYEKYISATGACYARNQEIAERCDAMIALWDGKSGGTIDVVRRARELERAVFFYPCWTNLKRR